MKNKLIFGILLLSVLLSQAAAMAPGSSDRFGSEKNNFTTEDTVYLAHMGSIVCGEDSLWNSNLTVYIVPNSANLSYGANLSGYNLTALVPIGSNSKITTTAIWENPQVGEWDAVLDINKNGIYDETCPDMMDDLTPAGFTVTLAESQESSEDLDNQTEDNETAPSNNATANQTTATENATAGGANEPAESTENSSDMTPILIIVIAVIIAVIIVVWTIRTMR